MISIAVCSDEKFSNVCLTCLASILETNIQELEIYVLELDFSFETKQKFQQLSSIFSKKITLIHVSEKLFNGFVVNPRYSVVTYFRFYLPEILPHLSKILYLDCDILVRGNINDLWNIKIDNHAIGVVIDQLSDDLSNYNTLKISTPYFNAGVMLINLKYWRNNGITKKLVDYIQEHPNVRFYDQDALNVTLGEYSLFLDYKYNYQQFWYTDRLKTSIHFSKWNEIIESGKDPIIVHFCLSEKPWHIECDHPLKNEFIQVANKYSFINLPIIRKYPWYRKYLIKAYLFLQRRIW